MWCAGDSVLLVIPQVDIKTWIKFASLCRKNGRMALSLKTLMARRGRFRNDGFRNRREPFAVGAPSVVTVGCAVWCTTVSV